jgi:hypothetical protein
MNERIKQLLNEATSGHEQEHDRSKVMTVSDKEMYKFAQLIVKECGEWFNNRLVVEPDYEIEHRVERNRAVVSVMKEFNIHFGVEE